MLRVSIQDACPTQLCLHRLRLHCLLSLPFKISNAIPWWATTSSCPYRYLIYYYSAWNVGIHLYLAWVGLDCLFLGINSIIWNHNTVNWAPVWCDISQFFFCFNDNFTGAYLVIATRFNVGISIAIPAVVLCINRRLYLLASPTIIVPSQTDRNREVIIDLVIGIGLPIIVMALGLSSTLSLYLLLIHI